MEVERDAFAFDAAAESTAVAAPVGMILGTGPPCEIVGVVVRKVAVEVAHLRARKRRGAMKRGADDAMHCFARVHHPITVRVRVHRELELAERDA